MNEPNKCPGCGKTLCQLCEEKHAELIMKNKKTGKQLKVCRPCHQEVWGGMNGGEREKNGLRENV